MDFSELTKMKEDYQRAVREEGEGILKKFVSEFFTSHPEIKRLGWTQYTPYFNDGEPCIFRVGEVCFDIPALNQYADYPAEDDEDDYINVHNWVDSWSIGYHAPKEGLTEDTKFFSEAIDSMGDILEIIFGDHTQVVVYPDHFEVTEYEHD